ncbi:hypothetical protein HLH26_11990 [Gluconacetobacter sp. 1b LMG 1731]|uniref:Plasmid segregation centromere-binding protein ParG n=1 Tax=Gluconacetobacter dulcium TaxID=2729096 RepID=A0A7W4IMC6_9PROT|nr:hypothetical protein [Gluconacetobacter dulcium]MBB2165242.1 hypothetical protein [Gluconacetobacter dulcium]MBB2194349.1 hypothetical protein [Gluconacetobacter dulcium]
MTKRRTLPSFASRPADPERWVKAPDKPGTTHRFTARLTIDVTPALRARLKVAAFQRGMTVADMLRALLAREFPDISGDVP